MTRAIRSANSMCNGLSDSGEISFGDFVFTKYTSLATAVFDGASTAFARFAGAGVPVDLRALIVFETGLEALIGPLSEALEVPGRGSRSKGAFITVSGLVMASKPLVSADSAVPMCPLVEISGSPRERGRQYGEQAEARIRRGIEHYSAQMESSRLGWRDIAEIVARFEPTIASYEPRFIDEMRGIAEGAAVDYAAIVMLNARTEVLKLAQQHRPPAAPTEEVDPDGCTGIIAMPEATAEGRLIHAQNWDWKTECAETAVVLKVRGERIGRGQEDEHGIDLLTFTEAGGLARAGFNSRGISITGNYLESDRDYRQLGVPLALIRRKVLEQRHFALALQTLHATPKSASNNLMVAHTRGQGQSFAFDFECVPDETFTLLPERGLLVHANHFQSQVALTKIIDRGIAHTPDSLYRDIRVRQLIEPHVGRLTIDHVKSALFDDFESPWSVCRPPRLNTSNNLSASVAMIVMEPAAGTMQVSMLPALHPSFTSFDLDTATA